MNREDDDLLQYALGLADEDAREAVEARAAIDPSVRARLRDIEARLDTSLKQPGEILRPTGRAGPMARVRRVVQRVRGELASLHPAVAAVAACLVVAGPGALWAATRLREADALAAGLRNDLASSADARVTAERAAGDLARQLAAHKASQPVVQTPDTRRWEFDQARKLDVVFGHQGAAGRLAVRFRGVPRPAHYTGIDVLWDSEKVPADPHELVYNEGSIPFSSVVTHDYPLPSQGSQRVTVTLRFFTTWAAQKEFNTPRVVTHTIDLVLTPGRIRPANVGGPDEVTVTVGEAADRPPVETGFSLGLTVRVPPAEQSPAHPGVIHALVRPIDGPADLRGRFWVQSYLLDLADLRASGKGLEQRDVAWISLNGILAQAPPGQAPPTRFEVLVVNLPVRLGQAEISSEVLDLDGRDRALVKVTRLVQVRPPAGE
ncbi:MAG TPA: hypothetical protein VD866_25655 [Urbifossiella sp.]|nr:hypothetical protein [Urbifossiella sp.]